MRNLISIALLAFAATSFAATALAQESATAKEIRRQDETWLKVAKRGNVAKFVSFYAPDALVFVPNQAACKTPKQILASMTEMFSLPGFRLNWDPEKVVVAKSGEIGYCCGHYQLSFKGADGDRIYDLGKFAEIWKKQPNGKWKCVLDTFNSDLPADPLLAAWTVRYEEANHVIRSRNVERFAAYFAPEFVAVQPDGKTVTREDLMNQLKDLFKAKKFIGGEQVVSVKKDGDTYAVEYKESWKIVFEAQKPIAFSTEGLDYWKKLNGRWQIVKEVVTR